METTERILQHRILRALNAFEKQEIGDSMSENTHLDRAEQNIEVVKKLFDALDGTREEARRVIDEVVVEQGYIQHNPMAGDGRDGLQDFFPHIMRTPNTSENPVPDYLDADGTVEVKYIASGNMVVRMEIRYHGVLLDIFRVENGLLHEHWDAFNPNPGTERPPGL
ncbi:hypothetical protein [Rhodococcus erythropolis]|uniref:nuclear transport factor 2 family protein n=1 Tax=Rhodococcus erythropolis TaxID=1833 RepID=UPI0011875213|nr:hypothetical protein [Rhodococcus erythropolis]